MKKNVVLVLLLSLVLTGCSSYNKSVKTLKAVKEEITSIVKETANSSETIVSEIDSVMVTSETDTIPVSEVEEVGISTASEMKVESTIVTEPETEILYVDPAYDQETEAESTIVTESETEILYVDSVYDPFNYIQYSETSDYEPTDKVDVIVGNPKLNDEILTRCQVYCHDISYSYQVTIEGDTYTFPCSINEFKKCAWAFEGYSATHSLLPGYWISVRMSRNGKTINLGLFNPYNMEILSDDCIVAGIYARITDGVSIKVNGMVELGQPWEYDAAMLGSDYTSTLTDDEISATYREKLSDTVTNYFNIIRDSNKNVTEINIECYSMGSAFDGSYKKTD